MTSFSHGRSRSRPNALLFKQHLSNKTNPRRYPYSSRRSLKLVSRFCLSSLNNSPSLMRHCCQQWLLTQLRNKRWGRQDRGRRFVTNTEISCLGIDANRIVKNIHRPRWRRSSTATRSHRDAAGRSLSIVAACLLHLPPLATGMSFLQ